MRLIDLHSLTTEELFAFYHRVLEVLEDNIGQIEIEEGNLEDQRVQEFCELEGYLKIRTLNCLNRLILRIDRFDAKIFDNYFADISSGIRLCAIKNYCKDQDIHPMFLADHVHRNNLEKYRIDGAGKKTCENVIRYLEQKRCE